MCGFAIPFGSILLVSCADDSCIVVDLDCATRVCCVLKISFNLDFLSNMVSLFSGFASLAVYNRSNSCNARRVVGK